MTKVGTDTKQRCRWMENTLTDRQTETYRHRLTDTDRWMEYTLADRQTETDRHRKTDTDRQRHRQEAYRH